MRTVKWWVRYLPKRRAVIQRVYRTKAQATKALRSGETVIQVKGFYFDGDEKP